MIPETALLECLVPSWWEVQVTVAAAAFVIFAYWFFSLDGDANVCDRVTAAYCSTAAGELLNEDDKVTFSFRPCVFLIRFILFGVLSMEILVYL